MAGGSLRCGIIRRSETWPLCGGLAAAELKKKEEDTDGNEETESLCDSGLSGGEGRPVLVDTGDN